MFCLNSFYLALKDMALWSMVFRKKSWIIFCVRKICTSEYIFLLCCTSSSSWGGTLKRESWEIWYLLNKKIRRGRERKRKTKGFHSTWSYSALPAWRASPPPRRPPREGWWRRCPCSEGPVPPGQRWPLCTYGQAMKDLKLIQTYEANAQNSQDGAPTSSTAHPPAGPTADWTQQSCCPPTWCARTSGCRSPPCKELQSLEQTNIWNMECGIWMTMLSVANVHLKVAVKSIWSTRAVTMEKGEACPSPWGQPNTGWFV